MELTKEEIAKFKAFLKLMNIQDTETPKRREKGKGSVVYLGKGRRKPYGAYVTVNKKQKALAYFESKSQAERCLELYDMEKNGQTIRGTTLDYCKTVSANYPRKENVMLAELTEREKVKAGITEIPTFKEIYDKIVEEEFDTKSPSTRRNYDKAIRKFKDLWNIKINVVGLSDIETIFNYYRDNHYSTTTTTKLKTTCKMIFDWAIKHDFCEKNYANFLIIQDKRTEDEKEKNRKVIFSTEDIKKLRANDSDPYAQAALVLIYTGMRPSELLELKIENIHIENRYMIGGIKTSNGINRIIPIHESIVPYVQNFVDSNIVIGNTYAQFNYRFRKMANRIKINERCTPHSGRHTFSSISKRNNLNDFLVTKIMGHSPETLKDKVYTHIDAIDLIKEVNKLPTI